jgi:hypothetical protein
MYLSNGSTVEYDRQVTYDAAGRATNTYDKDVVSSNTLWYSTYSYDKWGTLTQVAIDDDRDRMALRPSSNTTDKYDIMLDISIRVG